MCHSLQPSCIYKSLLYSELSQKTGVVDSGSRAWVVCCWHINTENTSFSLSWTRTEKYNKIYVSGISMVYQLLLEKKFFNSVCWNELRRPHSTPFTFIWPVELCHLDNAMIGTKYQYRQYHFYHLHTAYSVVWCCRNV